MIEYQRAGIAQLVEQRFCKAKVGGSNPLPGSIPKRIINHRIRMSQERLAKLECTACKRTTADTQKNKKKLQNRLELKKFCKWCKKHTMHKETK